MNAQEKKADAPETPDAPPARHARRWAVKVEGNPEVVVPTPAQHAAGKKAHSEAEAFALYAEHMHIISTVNPYSASPLEEPAAA